MRALRALGQRLAGDFFREDLSSDFDLLVSRIRFVAFYFMVKKLAVTNPSGPTLARVRCGERLRAHARENLKLRVRPEFDSLSLLNLNGKVLIAQFIVVGFINRVQELFDPFAPKNIERFATFLSLWRPLQAKQKVCQPATMIQMQVTDPNCIEVRPVEILPGHAMSCITAAVEQNRTAFRFQPKRCGSPLWMRNRSTGAEHD